MELPGHLSLWQVNYCTVLLSSVADRLALGSAYHSKCVSGEGPDVTAQGGDLLWPPLALSWLLSSRRSRCPLAQPGMRVWS